MQPDLWLRILNLESDDTVYALVDRLLAYGFVGCRISACGVGAYQGSSQPSPRRRTYAAATDPANARVFLTYSDGSPFLGCWLRIGIFQSRLRRRRKRRFTVDVLPGTSAPHTKAA